MSEEIHFLSSSPESQGQAVPVVCKHKNQPANTAKECRFQTLGSDPVEWKVKGEDFHTR